MYIAAVNGSPIRDGDTQFLIDEILKTCRKQGAETEIINAAEAVSDAKRPFCTSCSSPCNQSCYRGTKLMDAYEKLVRADAVVFASPVYFGNVTGQMKVFFDKIRVFRGQKAFIGKPAGCAAVGFSRFGGQEETIKALHTMCLILGMTVVNSGHEAYDCGHLGVAAQSPASADEFALSRCKSMGLRLVQACSKG